MEAEATATEEATSAGGDATELIVAPEDHADVQGPAMVRGTVRGILVALPLALGGVFVMLVAIGRPWNTALATSWLPGTLLGVFFGGFVGVIRSME